MREDKAKGQVGIKPQVICAVREMRCLKNGDLLNQIWHGVNPNTKKNIFPANHKVLVAQ